MKRELFVKKLAHEVISGDLAVFIGAGLSMASGGSVLECLTERRSRRARFRN